MTEKTHPLPWWPRDFAADEHVLLMNMEAEGVYRRLLDHQWLHGSIPDDLAQVATLCKGMPLKRLRAIWPSIAPCFIPLEGQPGRLVNSRMERVRAEAEAYREKKAAAGRKGMAARYQTPNTVITEPLTNAYPPSPTPSPTPVSSSHHSGENPDFVIPDGLTPEGADALTGMLRASPAPEALLAEVRAILTGMRPGTPTDPALVSQALVDLRLAGATRPTGKQLRAFTLGAQREAEPKPAREPSQKGYPKVRKPDFEAPAPVPRFQDPYATRRGGLTKTLADLMPKVLEKQATGGVPEEAA